MPQRHQAKEICFEMWKAGKPFKEIYKRTNANAATVTNWIREWERGAQRTWTPDMPHRGGYTAQEQD